jgi:two-component system, cell cycle response regulator DivK
MGSGVREKERSCRVIMVVDDYEGNREFLCAFLNIMGFKVLEACNGFEAVEVAIKARPDLIIMDLSMPVLDGYGAVRLLREAPKVCDIPIVACTANDSATHRASAISGGFDEFLSKPIDFDQLNIVIHRLLKAA